jgi:two-component system, OmpR family, sensor histidine kinase ChvG
MALESGPRAWPLGPLDTGLHTIRRVGLALWPIWSFLATLINRAGGAWIARVIGTSLSRRIFVSNIAGLCVLLAGMLLLSKHNAWLIEAKRDSLIAQGEIIAAGIASNAVEKGDRVVLDPDKLPEIEGGKIPFRNDGFSSLDMSIQPEIVTPVLRRLMQRTKNVRARIYARDGALIVDSAQMLQRGQVARHEPVPADQPKARTFWTRLSERINGSDLPVYQEIGSASGTTYPEVRMALNSGTTNSMVLLTKDREQIVSIAAPIRRLNTVQGVLLLSTKPGEIDSILATERKVILTIGALALLATILASMLLARTVAGPMRRLSAAAEHVSHNITARQELPEFPGRTDEVGQMAQAFRSMTTALYRRIEASEKFAADVAHELKNPLTAARSTAESLTYAKTEEERNQLVTQIQVEIKRLNRLITDVSNASRLDAELARQQTEPVNLLAVTSGIVATFGDILTGMTKTISIDIAPGNDAKALVVEGHEGRISQVLTNLIDNALSFSPDGGAVKVKLLRNGGQVEIAIEDQGPGIDADKLETVFDRFYTYRPTAYSSRGTNSGLGLSISREIVRAHGGRVWAENRYANGAGGARIGARFVVQLPASQNSTVAQRNAANRARRA